MTIGRPWPSTRWWTFVDSPPDFLTTAPATLGTFLVTFGLGYLVAALVDWLLPEEPAEVESADAGVDYARVGSEQ